MSSNDTAPDPVVIAEGSSYFLHVTGAGQELRFKSEPPLLMRKTHFVRVKDVDGDVVIEETTLTGPGLLCPRGAGWKHVKGHTFRRRRRQGL
jgi:hypothetical protein